MKLNCGPSIADRLHARWKRIQQWHTWFAWRPVRLTDNRCVWLERVLRRYEPGYEIGYWVYEAIEFDDGSQETGGRT